MTNDHNTGSITTEVLDDIVLGRIKGGPHGELLPGVVTDLDTLVTRAETDDTVRAVVLTSDHPTRFIAHADIRWLQEGGAVNPELSSRAAHTVVQAAGLGRRSGRPSSTRSGTRFVDRTPLGPAVELDQFHALLLRMNTCGAIFVAALNGSALGGGCEIALACDFRVMARGDFVIGQPEILLGFIPGGGGTQRLARLLGAHQALKLILDGRGLSPDKALETGVVDEVVEPGELMESALDRAAHYGRRDKNAVGAAKRAVHLGGSVSLPDGLRLERAEFLQVLSTPGTQAAMLGYQAATQSLGELPLYSRGVYERAVRLGHVAAPVTDQYRDRW